MSDRSRSGKSASSTRAMRARGLGLVVALAAALLGPAPISGAEDLDDFADCLSTSGAIFYGAHWCPVCHAQKRMFGASFRHLDYVECYEPGTRLRRSECHDVDRFPTWEFADGTRRSGRLSFATLARLTGCTPPD